MIVIEILTTELDQRCNIEYFKSYWTHGRPKNYS